MEFKAVQRFLSASAKNARAQRRMTLGRSILVYATSVFVAAMIGASLWVSVAGISQKIMLVRGTGQIIDVVDLSRKLAQVEHNLGDGKRDDLLARLDRMGQIQVAEDGEGLKSMLNPWGGTLVAYTASNSLMRIETQVSPIVCARLIGLLTHNLRSVGLQKIDARGAGGSWRQIYVGSDGGPLSKKAIVAGCHDAGAVLLALTFSLR